LSPPTSPLRLVCEASTWRNTAFQPLFKSSDCVSHWARLVRVVASNTGTASAGSQRRVRRAFRVLDLGLSLFMVTGAPDELGSGGERTNSLAGQGRRSSIACV